MKKNESDLDEELNENLDFLEEDHHTANHEQLGKNEDYLPPTTTSLLHDPNKKIFIIIIGIAIAIIPIGLMIHNKKKNHAMLNANKQSLVAISNQPQTNNEPQSNKSTEQLDNANNSLNWQDLKKSVGEKETEQHLNENKPSPSINSNNANTFEINIPIGTIEQNQQLKSMQHSSNYIAQENINELKAIIENITQELSNNVGQIKELQNNLQEISRSIGNVNNSVNSIDSRIHSLAGTVDNLSFDVKNVKKYIQEEDLDLTSNIKPSEPDLFTNTPEYVVHAVIPGRAWLKSSSGQIITVAEGDLLGDYGKIALIDAANNLVRTSSGVVFR